MEKRASYKDWITDEGLEQLKAWAAKGMSDAGIAKEIGINKSVLSRWRATHPEIRDALVRYVDANTGRPIDRHDLHKGADSRRKMVNVSELQSRIDAWMKQRSKDKKPLTVSSLCLWLGISRQTFNRYKTDESMQTTEYIADPITGEYTAVSLADVLKRAELAIESDLEDRMITLRGNVTGLIFELKNHHGYVDSREINSTVTANRTKPVKDEDIDQRIKELLDKQGQTVKNASESAGLHVVR